VITDAGSATSSAATRQLNVKPNTPPTARFVLSPSHPVAGQPVHFNAASSSDPDGDSITTYHWSFGDGTTASGSSASVTHRYSKPATKPPGWSWSTATA